jgi:hypothetical protein
MLRFDPPNFRQELRNALAWLEKKFQLEPADLSDDLARFIDEGCDPTEPPDDLITPESVVAVCLPRCDVEQEMAYGTLLEIVQELATAELTDNVECWTEKRLLLRVELRDVEPPSQALERLKILATTVEVGGQCFHCGVVSGLTIFGFLVYRSGNWDKYFPPVLAEDLFIEIKWQVPMDREVVRTIVDAYLYELDVSAGMVLSASPRPLLEFEEGMDDEPSQAEPVQLRPLMLGRGMPELLKLYHKGQRAYDPSISLLFMTQVIEFVAQTVLREEITERIQAKLAGRRALNPDAAFVAELQAIVEEHRSYRSDTEALKLTVSRCCEASELVPYAPKCLRSLHGL